METLEKVKERPILFSTPMVKAILEGRKTVTRRLIKPQPTGDQIRIFEKHYGLLGGVEGIAMLTAGDQYWEPVDIKCPYGEIPFVNASGEPFEGDVLWVRETWDKYVTADCVGGVMTRYRYKADDIDECYQWKPSIHMPKRACRLRLKVKSIRVERLHAITEEDAIREGVIFKDKSIPMDSDYYRAGFHCLWESINGKESWEANPWVWRIEFTKL